MKVKCKKFLSPGPDANAIELKSSGFLTKGKEYIVLGISSSKSDRYLYLVGDDMDVPGYFNIRQFDIVSNHVPSRWVVEYIEECDVLGFYPKTWLETEAFWDKLIDDRDPDIIALFEQERDLIYQEEPVP